MAKSIAIAADEVNEPKSVVGVGDVGSVDAEEARVLAEHAAAEREANKYKPVIMLNRESYPSNGKEYYSYRVRGTLRGKEITAEFAPADGQGYLNLDTVYNNGTSLQLHISTVLYKDDFKKTRTRTVYTLFGVGEYGEPMEVTVKPRQVSDKERFAMYYNQEVARLKHTAGK